MNVIDIQEVLDRIALMGEHIAPQITRRTVEYAKDQAKLIHVDKEKDDSLGKTPLFLMALGFMEGYCNYFDGYYNQDNPVIHTVDDTKDVVDDIIAVYGDEAPTSVISSCCDYAYLTAIKKPDNNKISSKEVQNVIDFCSLGYMEGALSAIADKERKINIRPFSDVIYTPEMANKAWDFVIKEIEIDIADAQSQDSLRELVCVHACYALSMLIYPRSGNNVIKVESPLAVSMLYILGFFHGCMRDSLGKIKGIKKGKDVELMDNSKIKHTIRDVKGLLTKWGHHNGCSEELIQEATCAMFKHLSGDGVLEEDVDLVSGVISYGVGYLDGSFLSSSEYEQMKLGKDNKLSEVERGINKELEEIFNNMSDDEKF